MTYRTCDTRQTLQQIGMGNILAISGGRVEHRPTGITLPVAAGYRVTVDLDADDTYVVRRIYRRGAKEFIKGQRTGVYCDEVGEVAYRASCFRTYDQDEW